MSKPKKPATDVAPVSGTDDPTREVFARIRDKRRAGTIGPVTLGYIDTYIIPDQQRFRAKMPRGDALSRVIDGIVRDRQKITESELLTALKNRKNVGVSDEIPGAIIEIVDEEIHFIGNDRQLQSAPLSGLKDRLSKAKKKLKIALAG